MDLYQQFPNSSLNLDPEFEQLLEIFQQRKITTFDLLTTSPVEISNKIYKPVQQINKFISILKIQTNKGLGEQLNTGDEIHTQIFTTGDVKFDELLDGGIRTGMITEIFGESSTAKSQFCMQLTKTVQLPKEQGGLEGNAVYISTEGNLETKRLIEINPQIDNVYYINCTDLETQEHILNVQLPILLQDQEKNIKLVIIDSISHHLRVELLTTNFEKFKQNQNLINDIGIYLNSLCHKYDISIVVTNQISDKPDSNILNTQFRKITMDYQIGWLSGWSKQDIQARQDNEPQNNSRIATLGLNWVNNVYVRILLKKNYKPNSHSHNNDNDDRVEQQDSYWIMKRYLKLIFSPFSNVVNDDDQIEFKIFKDGLYSV